MIKPRAGFTIVELLIVIVVIAILATITIVAYNGIQDRARTSAMTSALTQAGKKMTLWRVDNPDQYPASLAELGVNDTDTIAYQYTFDNTAQTYCITATNTNGTTYYISNTSGTAQSGTCSGYNLLVWNKVSGTAPVPSAAVDTSTFRTSTASMRLDPGQTQRNFRGNPYGGTIGQKYTVSFWLKTDASWNGTINNSKIRFANGDSGAFISACAYSGVKIAWTQVSCMFTLSAANPKINIAVGNDGTTGSIWIDDLVLSLE